jgi:pyroglutamyl-peptidase
MRKMILTGFDLFGSYKHNPTRDLAIEYDGQAVGNVEVVGAILPCSYYRAFEALKEKIQQYIPVAVLNAGLFSRIPRLRIETVGRNIMNGKYPDCDGLNPQGEPLIEGGKDYYRINTDSVELSRKLFDGGISSDVSVDAEGFVCNSLIYLTAREIYEKELKINHAFFHIPWTTNYENQIDR